MADSPPRTPPQATGAAREPPSGAADSSPIRTSILFENDTDISEDHVRRMAAALAPQLDQLENLLGDMPELGLVAAPADSDGSPLRSTHNRSPSILTGDDEQDDDLDEEMNQLLSSEAMLRQQMEMADDFSSSLLASLSRSPDRSRDPEEQFTPTKRYTVDPDEHRPSPDEQRMRTSEHKTEHDIDRPHNVHERSLAEPPEQRPPLSANQDERKESTPDMKNDTAKETQSSAVPSTPSRSKIKRKSKAPLAYTLQDHADHLRLSSEKIGGWYYCDMTKFLHIDPMTTPKSTNGNGDAADTGDGGDDENVKKAELCSELVKEYCLPIPYRKLKRLYIGLLHHDVNVHTATSKSGKNAAAAATPTKAANVAAMRAAVGSPLLSTASLGTPGSQQKQLVEPEMQTITAKFSKPVAPAYSQMALTPNRDTAASGQTVAQPQDEPLPVRTLSLRVRPDVLCGSVMEAVNSAFTKHTNESNAILSHALKRQGGHLRAAFAYPLAIADGANSSGTKINHNDQSIVAYVVDVQLCSLKGEELERRLVIRFFHIQDDLEALQEVAAMLNSHKQDNGGNTAVKVATCSKVAANSHIKQACSLIQRLMSAASSGSSGRSAGDEPLWLSGVVTNDIQYDRREDLQRAIAVHLETNFKACPSVRDENKKVTPPTIRRLTLPALSSKDWTMFADSWPLVSALWEELETRDCTYNTLATLPFGQFPSLPTLDVHYCSQLRRLSRESMISQLLKSAKELEDYAKSAEYACATLLTLVGPMASYYGVPPLAAPRAKSLEEYPFEYTPPQVSCPPWGTKVMEALNQVQQKSAMTDGPAVFSGMTSDTPSSTPTGESQSIQAADAVQLVYDAFMKQDDEEQGARLGRKNAQVMDRLANMQSHQKAVIRNVRDAHIHSKVALKASDDFVNKAQRASNVGKPGHPRMLLSQVPLLHFRISQGASTSGVCYITPNQILFSTSYIPLVGSSKNMLFDLALVEFQVVENVTSTLLNPFPNTMNVLVDREVVYSFRPSLSPHRLWTFLNVVQTSSATSEFSQATDEVVEGEDGVLRLANNVSEDQYSI